MKNTTNTKTTEGRMETLRNAGLTTDNFFRLDMQVPKNTKVEITVNGEHMLFAGSNDTVSISDPIVQSIIKNGYVRNTKIHRRWITAQTFRMLNYVSPSGYRRGWDACLFDTYSYMYTFDMMLEEVRILSILEKEDREAFEERVHFFNKYVVVDTVEHYEKKLKKYISNQIKEKPRKCKNMPYVKLHNYGDVFVHELDEEVYSYIHADIYALKHTYDYSALYNALAHFVKHTLNKLPFDTPKAAAWKDAFKGSGSYYTLKNLVMWHDIQLEDYKTGELYDRDRSLEYLNRLLDDYQGECWRFNALLRKTIEDNNFDLAKSIAIHKANS